MRECKADGDVMLMKVYVCCNLVLMKMKKLLMGQFSIVSPGGSEDWRFPLNKVTDMLMRSPEKTGSRLNLTN